MSKTLNGPSKKRRARRDPFLEEVLASAPRLVLASLLRDKVSRLNIRLNERLLNRMAEHVPTKPGEPLTYSGNAISKAQLEELLTFTDDDLTELDRRLKRLEQTLPEAIGNSLRRSGPNLVRALKKNWPERRAWERERDEGFRERLEERWQEGLTPLRMLLTISREVGDETAAKRRRSRKKAGVLRHAVLQRLDSRACQVTAEVVALLEAGFADGAMARWRTLHELVTVGTLIAEFGDPLAERFLDHEAIEAHKSMETYQETYADLGYAPPNPKLVASIQQRRQEVLAKYEKGFRKDWGWAAADRGRDAHCWTPPAQIRTSPIKASGSYLEYLTAKRWSGQG
jgi:Family of unknown function (DUF5677)